MNAQLHIFKASTGADNYLAIFLLTGLEMRFGADILHLKDSDVIWPEAIKN